MNANAVSNLEIIVENISSYMIPGITDSTTINILLPFEYVKAYLNIKSYLLGNRRLLSTEEAGLVKFLISKRKLEVDKIGTQGEQGKDQMIDDMKQVISNFEKCKNSVMNFENQAPGYPEQLTNSGRTVCFPSYLSLQPKLRKKLSLLTMIGEMVFIVRPLAYLFLLKAFGTKSYKPYLVNLAIDALWLLIHFAVFRGRVFRKKEIRRRLANAFVNYMLRNPFLDHILKDKIIFKVLDLVVKNDSVKNLAIRLLEFRSSLSYTL
jgi:hypothetical protein